MARACLRRRAYQAVIVMGGPTGVYDEADYPFLRDEHRLLPGAIVQGGATTRDLPGAQLHAQALGAIRREKLTGTPSI
ncbi:MAG: hypothetical protein ONB06_07625 [candidate division KSB1 bacterium]|nr:hypothetical protein [candidate division KSB1 bacterium]